MSPSERDELILRYQPLVRLIARQLRRCLPLGMEFDDLVSLGTIGCIEAIQRFDPSCEVTMRSFLNYRIIGAMKDGIRKITGRKGSPRAITNSKDGLFELDGSVLNLHLACPTRNPEQRARARELFSKVARLPRRERFTIESYFILGKTLLEIGVDLGIGEARAHQIKRDALKRLREEMQNEESRKATITQCA